MFVGFAGLFCYSAFDYYLIIYDFWDIWDPRDPQTSAKETQVAQEIPGGPQKLWAVGAASEVSVAVFAAIYSTW